MCFESICGFSCPVALAVYYLPTILIGLVALYIHLRRRGFFKRSYVRFLRWLRGFVACLALLFVGSAFADCTPMTFEECTNAVNSLTSSYQQALSSYSVFTNRLDDIDLHWSKISGTLGNYCSSPNADTDVCRLHADNNAIHNDTIAIRTELDYIRGNLVSISNSISTISCCSSNGGNDGGGDGNDVGSCTTNCACAEQILSVRQRLDVISGQISQLTDYYIVPILDLMSTWDGYFQSIWSDVSNFNNYILLLDDSWYQYLRDLRQSVSQLRNNVLPSRLNPVSFANVLQGQAFIYSAEYKTQLLTELFGNTITQQLAQAFRLSRAFGRYEDSRDWLGIVNPDWVAAIDAYTDGGNGDEKFDEWIKGDGIQSNYFARLETYNQQIVKFLALMSRTNDLETTSTDDPYAAIDAEYEQAEHKATSDVDGTSSQLDALKSPFQRLYDCFVVLRSSLQIQNPSSTTSFRWVPDTIDFTGQGISSESQGISLDLSESSYLGRGVALFNSLFSFAWVALSVVVCGWLAFRCALLVTWVFNLLFGLVSKIGDR